MAKIVYDFLGDTRGVSAVDYAVLAACILLAIALVLPELGHATSAMYEKVATALK